MQGVDLSPLGLFLGASLVGKAVMAVLFLASLWCWVLIVEGAVSVVRLRRAVRQARAGGPLAKSLTGVAAAGDEEARRRIPGETVGELRSRISDAMARAARELLTRSEGGLPNLAVISSVAPFVGLFGTVWGIMSSFAAIGQAQDTSLATVAPGIAESLAATAYGLAAAIPASIGYNRIGAAYGAARTGHGLVRRGAGAGAARPSSRSRARRRAAPPRRDALMALSPRKIGEGLYQPLADINVTPLVDVMLVLLIIFMVTAPMLATGIKVNLPSAKTAQPLENKEPVVVAVAKDGALSVGKDPVSRDELAATVKAKLGDSNGVVQLRGDRDASYGDVVSVMDELAANGISRIAIVSGPRRAVSPAPAAPNAPPVAPARLSRPRRTRRRRDRSRRWTGASSSRRPSGRPGSARSSSPSSIALHAGALFFVSLSPKTPEQAGEVIVDIQPEAPPAEPRRRRPNSRSRPNNPRLRQLKTPRRLRPSRRLQSRHPAGRRAASAARRSNLRCPRRSRRRRRRDAAPAARRSSRRFPTPPPSPSRRRRRRAASARRRKHPRRLRLRSNLRRLLRLPPKAVEAPRPKPPPPPRVEAPKPQPRAGAEASPGRPTG